MDAQSVCDCKVCRFSKLKLAALSPEITDNEVGRMLLYSEVRSEDDINYVVGFLEKYRPDLIKRLNFLLAAQQ